MKYCYIYDTVIGKITITADKEFVYRIEFGGNTNSEIREIDLIKKTYQQLSEYFCGKRKIFDIPLKLEGTEFQLKVWQALQKIPYGATRTYKELAAAAGNEKACRAAGMCNNKNPIAIIIPCHRVIGSSGKLVGYAGGLKIKQFLLDLEKNN